MHSLSADQLFGLNGRVVLITGATGYLGQVLVKGIARAGAIPVVAARTENSVGQLVTEIQKIGADCMGIAFDVADAEACKQAVEKVSRRFGKLHGIVNGANTGRAGTIDNSTHLDFELACRQNLAGPFALIQSALPMLSQSARECAGGSSIVNISSMYGVVSPDPRIYGDSGKNNPPYYGAAKAGMIQLTRYLAVHLANEKIRVNSVSPGPFPPASIKTTSPEFHSSLCGKTPLGRIGVPDELVGPVLFLLSDAASYVTGINLPVDGGWTAW